jgi:monovalent cation/hydrogen antiporter
VLVAAGALALTVLVRAAYVTPLLGALRLRARRGVDMQTRLQDMQEHMSTPEGQQDAFHEMNPRRRRMSQRDLDRFTRRVTQVVADIQYFLREPLGWREGTAVVWAGMRGAVTVAAAQTLPDDTPQRSVLVLVAFVIAGLSLLVQGGTIGPLLHVIKPDVDPAAAAEQGFAEQTRIMELLRSSAQTVPEPPHPDGDPTPQAFTVAKDHRLTVIATQRSALLDARDNGTFDADALANALESLDAAQIAIEMRATLTS